MLFAPNITCLRVDTVGATLFTLGIFEIISLSSRVNMFVFVQCAELAQPTLLCLVPPAERVSRFVPRASIFDVIFRCAHSPKARSTITEETPIIIPRLESIVLSLLELILRIALIMCSRNDMKFPNVYKYIHIILRKK